MRPKSNMMRAPKTQSNSFDDFYLVSVDLMVKLATFLVGSQALAEEVVQEAFLQVHTDWNKLDNPGGYLRRVVVNRSNDVLRRRYTRRKHLALAKRDAVQTKISFDQFRESAEAEYFFGLLSQLKPKRRTAIVLKYYAGYTFAEIAEIMSIPEGTARSSVHRGLAQLKELGDDF